jgi:lipopolysaccharide/colanic/teichoic acid biosynthesis glycosyltransferase
MPMPGFATFETDAEARAEWQATHKLQRDPRITTLGFCARAASMNCRN